MITPTDMKKEGPERMDTAKIVNLCGQAIDLFLEYRDRHGYDEASAKRWALAEIEEGLIADLSGVPGFDPSVTETVAAPADDDLPL